ncbi:thymidylate synthase [Candidatus Phytoplasma oryzae]|uniref:Thymidylate synthase n=1 Tax=Candidatus Phytoplasma oryzae TaxID=203274 RepID=A0A139JQJ4_9MOLU|nr:thymidylate synthase [Candidatus Phytoplasma oryzae]KXT29092.1 thymidylate synthase [Candidatus Phytoplasma oryzae]KXT29146.1 thymidylate synthase [Candidatus Phytoplasma oryzae]RAM57728.1 thymidylate synthase [Candidatus Phytoplasma oryzae]
MKKYLDLCQFIIKKGVFRQNRTNIITKSIFGYQMHFNLNNGFPLLTTKKIHLNSIIHELLWFIKGDTNIRYLVQNNVKIWNEWPYQKYIKTKYFKGETLIEFVNKIKENPEFANKHGNLGPIYGKQWRDFSGIDQLREVIDEIKKNPFSRRLLISAWNVPLIKQMILPPCHVLMQFYVNKNQLSLQLFQRSADVFLGLPFNIASYSLLLMMIAQITDLKPNIFIHTSGDAHIYSNHLDQIKIQIQRKPKKLPKIILNPNIKKIDNFRICDFVLKNYNPHNFLKGEIAI